jgi:hypothetical protein
MFTLKGSNIDIISPQVDGSTSTSGFYITGTNIRILGGTVDMSTTNTGPGIGVYLVSGATNIEAVGLSIINNKVGVKLNSGSDNCNFTRCVFSGNTSKISDASGGALKFNRCTGHVSERNGTATVADDATYVDVTHGLAITPTAGQISVTPTNNLGDASFYWISNIGASTFRINVDADPGAGTATFVWQIN